MSTIARLPDPLMEQWDWQYEGACRDLDSSMFFYPEGERGNARRRRASTAKAVCATCPVIEECRSHALASREPYGIWGGMTEEERRSYLQAAAAS